MLTRKDQVVVGLSVVGVGLAAVGRYANLGEIAPLVLAGLALAVLASLVGRSVDALGERLGASATGVVQSALGNLPELFVCGFALHAGLYAVVRAALVGSILANVLLVLGLAFFAGGRRHGVQKFGTERGKQLGLMLVLALGILCFPALASATGGEAGHHAVAFSQVVAVVLLGIFACSLPATLAQDRAEGLAPSATEGAEHAAAEAEGVGAWPLWLALVMLTVASLGAAVVSDWFVHGLEPMIHATGLSEAFAGLVIVAIAGNAVENVVGVSLMRRNQAEYAVSVILQSPLQIALVLTPLLVLGAPLVGASFALTLSPLLIAALLLSALVVAFVVIDGESTWLEGAGLLGLYAVIASSFWWG